MTEIRRLTEEQMASFGYTVAELPSSPGNAAFSSRVMLCTMR